jgi:hypothetical protein
MKEDAREHHRGVESERRCGRKVVRRVRVVPMVLVPAGC